MEISLPKVVPEAEPANVAANWIRKGVESCHEFLKWEREHIIDHKPDPGTLARHKNSLKILLRVLRVLHAETLDPDYPDRTAAAELEAVIWKLNESWERIYNPMPEAEAEKLLSECFSGHGS